MISTAKTTIIIAAILLVCIFSSPL